MRVTAINTNQNTAKKQNFKAGVKSFEPLTDPLVELIGIKKTKKVVMFLERNYGTIVDMRMPSGKDAMIEVIESSKDIRKSFFLNIPHKVQCFKINAKPVDEKIDGTGQVLLKISEKNGPRRIVNKVLSTFSKSLKNIEKSDEYISQFAQKQQEIGKMELEKSVDNLEKAIKDARKKNTPLTEER